MKASIVDLRYRMNDILKALARNEDVNIYYHGKIKGVIKAVTKGKRKRATDHPLFGMLKDDKRSVEEVMEELRGGRYRDL